MCRSDPAGSGGAGCVGGGMRNVVRARATALEGPASRWPIVAPTAATPTATEPVIRNARRPGRDAGAAGRGGGPAGTQDAPAVRDVAGAGHGCGGTRRRGPGHGGWRRGGKRPLGGGRRPHQPGHGERPGRRPEQDRQDVDRAGVRAGQRGQQADQREHRQPGQPEGEPVEGGDADQGGEHRQDHEDACHQDPLVVGAERGDGEVLHGRRRVVDGRAADGHHRRDLRPGDPGDQLGHAYRDEGGDQARRHATAAMRPAGCAVAAVRG